MRHIEGHPRTRYPAGDRNRHDTISIPSRNRDRLPRTRRPFDATDGMEPDHARNVGACSNFCEKSTRSLYLWPPARAQVQWLVPFDTGYGGAM